MNNQFKEEFKNLDKNGIINIVNGCAGRDILDAKMLDANEKCYVKYIDNDGYGFWSIEWGWKKVKLNNMPFATGIFEFGIKITPFRIDFINSSSSFNPFKTNNIKQAEEYLFVYINNNCPHYKQAVKEETEKFFKFLDMFNNKKDNMEEELTK